MPNDHPLPTTRGTGTSDSGGRTINSSGRTSDKIVRRGGLRSLVTAAVAAIFAAQAEHVIAHPDTEMVPLLHRDILELLIGPSSVFTVMDAEAVPRGRSARRQARGRARLVQFVEGC